MNDKTVNGNDPQALTKAVIGKFIGINAGFLISAMQNMPKGAGHAPLMAAAHTLGELIAVSFTAGGHKLLEQVKGEITAGYLLASASTPAQLDERRAGYARLMRMSESMLDTFQEAIQETAEDDVANPPPRSN